MALTVGELNGILTIDDRAVDPALRRAENALRASGQRMGDDAERAGQQAGEGLGEGFIRASDGSLRNARGQFVAAGRRAGDAVGDGLTDGAADGADAAVEETGSRLDRLKLAAAAAGLAAGAVMMQGFSQSMEQSQITGRLGAQLGKTPAEAQRYGKLAGELFADGVSVDFQSAADAISAVMRAGIAPPGATNAQLKEIATHVSDLAGTFELDLGQTANAVGQMIKTGLAKNGREAVDALTVGLQKMGPRADDIADTFNEYSTIFRQLGVTGVQATGLLSQGLAAGARDTDVVADSLKEFVLITQDGGEEADKAFKKIGLSGKEMQAVFTKGGPGAQKALDQVFDRLRKVEDPADRAQIALDLFGTKAEDTQKALFALDPSKATASLGQVGGAADKMGNSLRDNAGANLTRFKNTAQQTLVNFMGGEVVPALIAFGKWLKNNEGTVKAVAAVISGVLAVAFTFMAINATKAAVASVRAWFTTGAGAGAAAARHVAAAGTVVASWLRMAAAATAQGARIAAAAVASAARTAAAWVASAARMNATWLVSMLRVAATTIAQFALMAARAVAWAATMAAQWLIAMGPVGWIIATVIGLVALIIANWDKVKAYTEIAWNWIWSKIKAAVAYIMAGVQLLGKIPGWIGKWFGQAKDWAVEKMLALVNWVKGLPGRVSSALSPLLGALRTRASNAFQAMRDAAAQKGAALISWVRGLPGRISSGLGSLGSLLTEKGRNVVQGLWSGIQAMGGWIKDKILGWAKSAIPGPIAKALGIKSPSRVTKEQGRWIARGLIEGLTGSQKQVRAAAYKIADIVRDTMARGARRTAALKVISRDAGWLDRLAKREEQVAKRLKDAQKKLADAVAARTKLAEDVKKGILDSANITQGSGPMTAEGIIARLQRDRQAAEAFTKNLAALSKKGVSKTLISQIAQAGVDGGAATAAALATANANQIRQINQQQSMLSKAATKAGLVAGDAMYGSGIRAAQGLVKGLESQQKTIEKAMLKIAKHMQTAIKKALGIKSPSRVMAQVGVYTAEGLRRGIDSERRAVNRSMESLVSTPTPDQMSWSSARARAAAGRERALERRVYSPSYTYHLTQREMTLRDLEALQRRQEALARLGRPR